MHVPVAGVEHVAHGHAMLLGDGLDRREDARELGARHDGVLDHEVRRQPTHGAECLLAPLPEPGALGLVACDAHRPRALAAAHGLHRGHVLLEAGEGAVEFDEQHRGGVHRIAGRVDRRLHDADGRCVEHLQCRGEDPAGDDGRHRRGPPRRDVVKSASSVRTASGSGVSRTVMSSGDAEAAFRPDERADEVVALGFGVGAAERHDFAVGEQRR